MADTKKIEIQRGEDPMQNEGYVELLNQGYIPKFVERNVATLSTTIIMEKEDGKV